MVVFTNCVHLVTRTLIARTRWEIITTFDRTVGFQIVIREITGNILRRQSLLITVQTALICDWMFSTITMICGGTIHGLSIFQTDRVLREDRARSEFMIAITTTSTSMGRNYLTSLVEQ